MNTCSTAEELEAKVHPTISEIKVRTISLLRVYKHISSDPMLVLLSDFFLSEIQVVCDFNEGLT